MQIARVVIVRVIVDGVLGVIVDVHIGHDEVLVIHVAIFVVIFCNWRCTLYSPREEWCNAVARAAAIDCCSCRHHERSRRCLRR